MDTIEIDNEIKELQNQIAKLEAKKKELEGMAKNHRLAEAIHSKQCHAAHEDQCGWYYENWSKPGYSRKAYLEKADAMLREMTFEQAMKVIKFL